MNKQQISLLQELELSIETIKSGLAMIQATKTHRPPTFLIFLILSTGLERVFKLIIGMRLLSNGNLFPSIDELKNNTKYGHNLLKLKNEILEHCYNDSNLTPPIVKEDFNFLKKDTVLNELLKQLKEFAISDRYVYMNKIADEKSTGEWLSTRWETLENTIVPLQKASEFLRNDRLTEYKAIIADSLVKCIERLLRALYLTITLGNMDSNANSASNYLYDFGKLQDSQLGTTKYAILGFSPV